MEWVEQHWEQLAAAAAALYALVSIIVALTPTPRDDEWLKRLMDWLSILKPKDADGTLKVPLTQSSKH